MLLSLLLMLATPIDSAAAVYHPEWKGDVNLDGDIDITDVTILIAGLLNDNITETMDVTQDGEYNITDVTALISMLMNMPSTVETFRVNGVSFTMRYVREGSFAMGATSEQQPYANQDENPSHEVSLSPYYIGETEVTQALWHAVMGDNPCRLKGYEQPVEWVTWEECQEFVYRLSQITNQQFRLPTEAEWEFAARGAHKSRGHLYSGSHVLDDVGWYNGNSDDTHHLIKTKNPNRVNLYDMSGNVAEWCQDWYAPYGSVAQNDPIGPYEGSIRVVRGGAWNDDATACRVSSRAGHEPAFTGSTVGLRLAMDAGDPYWFTLSHRTLRLDVGEQATVDILNGNGAYTIHNATPGIASAQVNGSKIAVNALSAGTTMIQVIDNESLAPTSLTVIVTAPVASWTTTVGGVTFKMIPVAGDIFKMGATGGLTSGAQRNEVPVHDVTLTDYCMGETEVTQALWKAVMGTNPSYFTGNLQRPVEQVSWEDCWEFIYRLNELTGKNFRLPTEADWEYAARGGRKTQGYLYAGGNDLNAVAWNGANAYSVGTGSSDYGTHQVATRQPNELGLYDMSGNVLEWCQNLTDSYNTNTHVNPVGATQATTRVSRGGSWHGSYTDCRVSRRYPIASSSCQSYRGLRLAIDQPGPYTFGLSKTVVKMEVGEQRSVDIYNGSGEYALGIDNNAVMSCETDGEVLTVTGTSAGTTSVIVTDELTHAVTWLTVIVTQPTNNPPLDFDIHGIGFRMIYIPQGIYAMGGTSEQGASAAGNENPVHRVALSDYYIGETEVTRALWHAVMGYTPRVFDDDMQHPMADVSWEECQLFVAKLSEITGLPFRLPSEAEWEYAARGARRSRGYKYSGSNVLNRVAWYRINSGDSTHYVGKKTANEMGIYDMSGNVDEWCQDWYTDYSNDIQFDPMGPDEGLYRVVRGGAYNSNDNDCRVSSRRSFDPDSASAGIGLRLALDFNNNYRLYLSRTIVWMEVGEVANVKIYNGTGDYTVDERNDDIVDFDLTDNNIQLTGLAVGTAHFYIKDNVTNSRRLLTVIVTQPSHVEYREIKYKTISWWMMYVRDGAFDMGATDEQGSDSQDNERPTHRVALNDYYIGQTEVTQELWDAVMYNDWSDHGEDAQKPVEAVNWEECQEFCARLNEIFEEYDLNFRLPTEAEWEFAARGGNYSRGYKYAGSNTIGNVAWYMGNSHTTSNPYFDYERHAVKGKNRNELRVYDMSGNVAEWCEDWYAPYSTGGQFNPSGPDSGTERVLRGGRYSSAPYDCRVAARSSMEPVWWSIPNGVGLRLAMDATGSHRFYLSRRVVRMYVGDHVDVNIYHGTGEYDITGDNNGIVNLERNGETLGLTGLKEGTATFVVTDTLTGEKAHLTAIVQEHTPGGRVKIEIDSLDFDMIYVRGGGFTMGSSTGNVDERPAHQVILPNYYIGETEVTQRLWQKVMGGNPSRFKDGDRPVERVTWEDCQEFVNRLNDMTGRSFRLPTEAEWEYAARGGRRTRGYPYSGGYNVGDVAWYTANSSSTTHPVMGLGANELGIYDMSGNVWEWCQDVYGSYGSAVQYNPVGLDASLDSAALTLRVTRGGEWNSDAAGCRIVQRGNNNQNVADPSIGLRLAMDAPTSTALRVSSRVVYMEVGDVTTISILNGSGNYATSGGSSVVSYELSGNDMTITGLKVGTTSINIKDNVTGYYTVVTVIVSAKKIPYKYKTITFWIKYVWGGSFDMGATDEQAGHASSDESPVHRVLLPSYGLGMTEVTQELWRAVMGTNPSVNTGNDKLPVDNVTYDDALEFVARLSEYFDVNFRLPSEAEWEYAARGAWHDMPYIYSGSNTIDRVAWYGGNSGGTTHVVETKQYNDEWISDMSGNIDEWCLDWYGPYSDQPAMEPIGPDTGSNHVVRGGRWTSDAAACRVSARSTDENLSSLPGVRIALELNHGYWFGLSRSVVSMYVGESRTVKVYNGSGDYTVTAEDGTIVGTSVDGDNVVVTGLKKGRTRITVYDNVIGEGKTFTAVVRERGSEPDQPDEPGDGFGYPFNMVYVKGGTFTMGATTEQGTDAYSNESPTHTVEVSSFMMSDIEVTQGLWKAVMGTNPSAVTGDLNRPVERVSWAAALEFIARLNERTGKNYRLPTEAEWEYAARGGVKSQGYKYAGSNTIDDVAWYSGNATNTHVVRTKAPNELGIYDMSGNVMEWCQDNYGTYSAESQNNPTGPSTATTRVRRGGGFSSSARNCRVSYRSNLAPSSSSTIMGLRLVRDIKGASWFGLSQSVVRMEQHERRTVNILNGNGSYTVAGGGNIVSCQVNGEKLLLTALQLGTTAITVTDNATNSRAYLHVVVTEPDTVDIGPVLPEDMVFTMVHVKGGTFTMGATPEQGSDAFTNESPAHEVTLPDYYIGDAPVTQGLWEEIMGSNPSYNANGVYNMHYPVENVSWEDCQLFIARLNALTGESFRLPTEAEWEFAARGGMKSQGYKFAGSDTLSLVGWYGGNAIGTTHEVFGKRGNELGLYDMSGNVAEWCQDWFGSYSSAAQVNPFGPNTGTARVRRGGYFTSTERYCRVSCRSSLAPTTRNRFTGLRLAMNYETTYLFDLSESVIEIEVGQSKSVDLINGGGEYSVVGGTGYVTWALGGDQLTVTGLQVGTTTLAVTDLASGTVRGLTVVVREATSVEEEEFEVNGVTFKMITVDGGTFTMGDNSIEDSSPAHQVTLSTYKIGQTEVTEALWEAVMVGHLEEDASALNYPMLFAPWDECQEFILKLNQLTGRKFRLLTEAEWEFAARGGNRSHGYTYSGSNAINDVAWYNGNSDGFDPMYAGTYIDVATKAPNELGIYDMSGGVWEMCQDYYGEYTAEAQTNPTGPTHSDFGYHVTRGGSYDEEPDQCRVAARGTDPLMFLYGYGFRLALDVDDSPKFRLSETVVTVEVGESASVNIVNGGGSYTVAASYNYVTTAISGNTLTVTGTATGTTSVYVTDAATGATAVLTVIVTQATTPVEHEYVDLGLPSGTLWATCNVGATNPEDYGDYFAWGETEPKTTYSLATYKWCNGSQTTMTKYCTNSSYGTVDNKMELDSEDDAATVNWGEEWCMASKDQFQELIDNCTSIWTTRNGVKGCLLTGPNGNTLFLPAAGMRYNSSLSSAGSEGYYWSGTLLSTEPCSAYSPYFYSKNISMDMCYWRCYGLTVRAVRASEPTTPEEEEFTVNGVTFKMITVDGGTFTMGDNESTLSWAGQSPEHQVTLSDYKIGQTQVTQALWQAVMGSNPSNFKGDVTCPVECVSWNDCQEFILRLNQLTGKQFRMLTEAEWEFAARGGNLSHGYKFSGSDTIDNVAWNLYNSNDKTHPVATKLSNELGIYDMTGNASEWCQDWYGSYSSSAQTNPVGPAEGNSRVMRDNGIAGFGGEGKKRSISHDDEGMYGGWYVTWRYNWHPLYYGFYDNYYDFLTPLPGLRLALDVDNSPKFRLSESVVTVDVGESANVNILNGGSSYTVAGGTSNVTTSISGNTLTVTGIAAGTASVYVTDAATGATAVLNVIVNPVFSPDEPEYVDLGLPSGTLWATRNVGATNPEDYGDYFAWGETEPKDVYDWSTYEWCNGTDRTLTKYCAKSYYGTVDDKTELDPEDDAAYVNMGPSWRMPTKEQQDELKSSCTWTWTTRNGVKGTLFTGPNGNTLFLPATGYRGESSIYQAGKSDNYWSRTLYSNTPSYAYYLNYNMGSCYTSYRNRSYGYSVRAVRATATPAPEEEEFTVNDVTFKMITVDGGTFTMGDDSSTDNDVKPAHQVTLSTFKIGQTEVTQALWQAVMGSNPSYFTGDLHRPVEMISWADCQRFVYQLNQLTGKRFRMTTEAEWEFAARGGNYSQGYTYSGSNTLDDVAWIGINNNTPTHTVGQKLPNELSLYDMTGNVTEWCQDLWYNYTSAAQTNPVPGTGFPLQRTGYPVTYRGSYDGPLDGNKECGVGMRLALDGDNSSKFGLSDPVITLAAGAQQAVDILNGNSSYSVAYNHLSGETGNFNEDEAVATYQLNGNVLNVTGVAPGITCMIITDAATGSQTALTVFVTESVATAMPVITTDVQDDNVIISATGDGLVLLYINGSVRENPCVYPRGTEDVTLTVVATAQETGKEMSTIMMEVTIPAKVTGQLPTDGQTYDNINGLKIENMWIFDRVHSNTSYTQNAICNQRARTATMDQGIIYVARSEERTVIVGNDTISQSVIHRFSAADGSQLADLPLTLNGAPYGRFLGVSSIGKDNFHHIWVAPMTTTTERYIPVYLVNTETGELTLIVEMDKGNTPQRTNYLDVIGDLTRENAECNIMTVANAVSGQGFPTLYRMHADRRGSWVGGFDGVPYMDVINFYPDTKTGFSLAPAIKMIEGNDDASRYSGEKFYIDCFDTAPVIYDISGTPIDSYEEVDPLLWPEATPNGCIEFKLDGREFLAYVIADMFGSGDGCQANICELGEDHSLGGMSKYWTIPADSMGKVYDSGLRIHCFAVEYGTDSQGREEVTLLTFKAYNGMAVYKISIDESYVPVEQSEGEWAYQANGTSPAMVGQTTDDHLFVRMDYNGETYDNMIKFSDTNPQLVWFWLDDDEIYQNTSVQALTPCPYNSNGDLYNEITYCSFQCQLYLPTHLELTGIGDEYQVFGDRLPTTSSIQWAKYDEGVVVDGITYDRYLVTCYNYQLYGCHFSSRNPSLYGANGALMKDNGALFGLYIRNKDLSISSSSLRDMIIANTEFAIKETIVAGWPVNDYRFLYGTGGNNVTQRFQKYVRVKLRC